MSRKINETEKIANDEINNNKTAEASDSKEEGRAGGGGGKKRQRERVFSGEEEEEDKAKTLVNAKSKRRASMTSLSILQPFHGVEEASLEGNVCAA